MKFRYLKFALPVRSNYFGSSILKPVIPIKIRVGDKLGGEIRGKKKLAKLLYFVDFDYFEKFQKPITGDIYKTLPMGPFPSKLEDISSEMTKKKEKVKQEM